MAAPAPAKLGFGLALCSGEHPDYPAAELLRHRPQSRGWQSARNATFPQELAFSLDQPARLTQLQILSHEYKIASRVEVFVSPPGVPPSSTAPWRRLGFLSLDPNEQSGHQARELKSVQLDAPAGAVRLLLHAPHSNRFNTAVQVGIVALNLIGVPLTDAPPHPAANGTAHPAVAPAAARSSSDGDGLDAETATQVAALRQAKAAAVDAEDYDEAKRLKSAIDRLVAVGGQLGQLEAAKAAAIGREDYDAAKALKADIARLRAGASDSPTLQQPMARRAAGPPSSASTQNGSAAAPLAEPPQLQQPPSRPQQPPARPAVSHDDVPVGGSSGGNEMPSEYPPGEPGPNEDSYAGVAEVAASDGAGAAHEAAAGRRKAAQRPGSPSKRPLNHTPPPSRQVQGDGDGDSMTPSQAYDDRPAKAAGAYTVPQTPNAASAVPPAVAEPPAAKAAARRASSAAAHPRQAGQTAAPGKQQASSGGSGGGGAVGAAPPGWDASAPEQLPPAEAQLVEPLEAALGPFVCSALLSKDRKVREAALGHLCRGLRAGSIPHDSGTESARELVRGAGPTLQRLLRDKVGSVLLAAQQATAELLRAHGAAAGRDASRLTAELLPVLLERAGDANARIAKGVEDTVSALADVPEAALASHTGPLLRPIKNQAAWKPVLARLRLISMLLPRVGVCGGGAADGGGFAPEPLMGFVSVALGNANAEVRALATSVAAAAGAITSPEEVTRHLPKDLNPKLREALSEALVQTGALSPDALKQPSAPARPPRASLTAPVGAPGGRKERKENLPPGRAPAVQPRSEKPAAPQKTAARAAKPPAAAGAKVAKQAADSAGPRKPPAKQRLPAQPLSPPPAAVPAQPAQEQLLDADDDFDLPADPAAAEAMLLQGLQTAERQFGATSLQAADAAAQLAVLYSQVGDPGRAGPLFERALSDLEAGLGPDHPDVAHAAIDLGVLRLEQGNEAEGRPLLQRALAIQTAALGPDHPDVAAIRDVLEEEG